MPTRLARARASAFAHQAGLCFYCKSPMCLGEPRVFAQKHRITVAQAKQFRCTAEHLKARQDGGTLSQSNIVAACFACNQRRHRRKRPPSPDDYQHFVAMRVSKGRWHVRWIPTDGNRKGWHPAGRG